VTTKVMRRFGSFEESSNLQRFIMGLMWPRPGKGIATTWWTVVCSTTDGSIVDMGTQSLRERFTCDRSTFGRRMG